MQFDLLPLPRIYFGENRFSELEQIVPEFGSRLFVVASSSALQKIKEVKKVLDGIQSVQDIPYEVFIVQG